MSPLPASRNSTGADRGACRRPKSARSPGAPAVEEHRFEPLTRISWRNSDLRFNSIGALLQSLEERPPTLGLVQVRDADDHRALQLLARNAEIIDLATNPGSVRLLWEVCQIPDFRKVMSDSHAR